MSQWRYLEKDLSRVPRQWRPSTPERVVEEVGRYYCVTEPALDLLVSGNIIETPRYHFRAVRSDDLGPECVLCRAPRFEEEVGELCPECNRGVVLYRQGSVQVAS